MVADETGPSAEDSGSKSWLGNLLSRVLTAVVLVPFILWLLYLAPKWGFQTFALIACGMAAAELMTMTIAGSRVLRAWGTIASLALAVTLLASPHGYVLFTVVLVIVAGGLLGALLAPEPAHDAGTRMAWLVGGPFYVGGMIGAVSLLHHLPNGGSWVVLSMMLAWFGDTGAYFAGRFFGKHKLYPRVSPKKTVEGAAGGLLGSIGGALLASLWYLPSLPVVHGLGLAVVAGSVGQAGDLVESLVKRSREVKDSGNLLPGHGGLLDRIDALMFTGACTWVYASWLWPGA